MTDYWLTALTTRSILSTVPSRKVADHYHRKRVLFPRTYFLSFQLWFGSLGRFRYLHKTWCSVILFLITKYFDLTLPDFIGWTVEKKFCEFWEPARSVPPMEIGRESKKPLKCLMVIKISRSSHSCYYYLNFHRSTNTWTLSSCIL